MPVCRICKQEVEKLVNSNRCRDCYNSYMRDYNLLRYHARRSIAIERLGGKCVKCESTEDLEFDHIDPNTKKFDIGKMLNFSLAKFWIEIEKCQLLCETCHDSKTSSENSVEHGQGKTGKRSCYCILCAPLKRQYMREYKRNR